MIARKLSPLFFAVALVACAEDRFVGTDLLLRSSPPVAVEVSTDEIVLPVGVAIEVTAESFWDEGRDTVSAFPFLLSADQAVLGVSRSTSGGWVLIGAREGETELWVQSRGSTRQVIGVRVTGQ